VIVLSGQLPAEHTVCYYQEEEQHQSQNQIPASEAQLIGPDRTHRVIDILSEQLQRLKVLRVSAETETTLHTFLDSVTEEHQ